MTTAERYRLLVIEDDPEMQYLLGAVLAGDDREVVCVDSGEEARRAIAVGKVDLVVLDLLLPDVDGRSLLSSLRDRPETGAVPVVVVTARSGPEIRQDCYALGADAFVEKPFDPDSLVADVAARLRRADSGQGAALVDARTGLPNKAGLRARCSSCVEGYGFALVQIDDFASRSESWGWDQTERIVEALARKLRDALPERVEVARIGGGDFALMVAGVEIESVSAAAADALGVVRDLQVEGHGTGGDDGLTATIGVVCAAAGTTFDEALDVAMRRIFHARRGSGERIAVEDPGEETYSARILVAEDDDVSATLVVHRLINEGFDVARFDNGQEAYDDAVAEKPDLVVLDVKMPGLDGFEVLERLRRDPSFAETPVIVLTSMGQEADVVRGFHLGADDYVVKPFSPRELSARIRRLLGRGRTP